MPKESFSIVPENSVGSEAQEPQPTNEDSEALSKSTGLRTEVTNELVSYAETSDDRVFVELLESREDMKRAFEVLDSLGYGPDETVTIQALYIRNDVTSIENNFALTDKTDNTMLNVRRALELNRRILKPRTDHFALDVHKASKQSISTKLVLDIEALNPIDPPTSESNEADLTNGLLKLKASLKDFDRLLRGSIPKNT